MQGGTPTTSSTTKHGLYFCSALPLCFYWTGRGARQSRAGPRRGAGHWRSWWWVTVRQRGVGEGLPMPIRHQGTVAPGVAPGLAQEAKSHAKPRAAGQRHEPAPRPETPKKSGVRHNNNNNSPCAPRESNLEPRSSQNQTKPPWNPSGITMAATPTHLGAVHQDAPRQGRQAGVAP